MKHILRGLWLIIAMVTQSFSQSVYTNPPIIAFDTSLTTVKDSLPVWIVNSTSMQIAINDINIYSETFSVKDTSFILNGDDSVRTWIFFSSIHNLTYYNFAFVETNLISGTIVVPLSGTKKYSEPLYKSTQGLSGEPLKTALNMIAKTGHTTLGYNTARDRMYGNIDNVGGEVECIYTGRKATFNTRSGATDNNFNCEHTWPQSKFSEADPMRSDINHLFSTDETANGKRSNFPFGVVVSSTWSVGGSKFGSGLGGQTVFEPRDEHKGDCARAMFYFITRYPNNYGSFWTESPYQESAFRDWNKKFPPTAKSKARNNGVQQYQGNRNPFIDHPEFVERISNFGGTAAVATAPRLVMSPSLLKFKVAQNIEPKQILNIAAANIGNAPLKITKTKFSNNAFSFADSANDIESNGYRTMHIRFDGTIAGNYSGNLILEWSDGTTTLFTIIALDASSVIVNTVKDSKDVPNEFSLEQNYPNPFNPATEIRFTIPASGFTALKVYNVLGKEVSVLVNEQKEAGTYHMQFNAENLPTGMYFYTLSTGSFTETKKMILMK